MIFDVNVLVFFFFLFIYYYASGSNLYIIDSYYWYYPWYRCVQESQTELGSPRRMLVVVVSRIHLPIRLILSIDSIWAAKRDFRSIMATIVQANCQIEPL